MQPIDRPLWADSYYWAVIDYSRGSYMVPCIQDLRYDKAMKELIESTKNIDRSLESYTVDHLLGIRRNTENTRDSCYTHHMLKLADLSHFLNSI